MFRKPRDTEAVVFSETSPSPADRRGGEKRRRVPSQPGVFLHAASYEDQPQVDITFGFPSVQRTEETEEEAPAASEEAVRKEQVRPEESVSCVTENFQAFMTALSQEELDAEESLQEAVELVFERAVQRADSAAVSAELCQRLSTVQVQSLSDRSASVSFRSLLVKHCQAEFRKNFAREDISQKSVSCLEPVTDVRVTDRLREERNNARPSCHSINTIRFIGELFKSKVLAEKAMHSCIRRLLQNGDGPSLESLCELLQLIQQDLEGVTSREVMDSFYNQMEVIAEEGKRASRLSLLLKDTVEERKRAGSTPHNI
ncbi:eukaryotic translation initiation factor 4 gamma 3-like [Limanda limanda]|uniref:eukaryotic translation initiation factor 4 gamma 3-like n=1 Tax=Limanda limanda TaxID=27771 RepID=UPI0029C76F64|nr:eukaryotic translation initiation factor 4 gamma 3-like [Limanda limanda]